MKLPRRETMSEVFRPASFAPPAFSFPQALAGAVEAEPDELVAFALDDSVQDGYWAEPLADGHSSPVVQPDDCSERADLVADDLALADCSVEADSVAADSVAADCWAAPQVDGRSLPVAQWDDCSVGADWAEAD